MQTAIAGRPAFSYLAVDLGPGEKIVSEAGAMSTMDAAIDLDASFNGGFFKGLARKFLGSESLFVSTYKNNTAETRRLTLVQSTPGDAVEYPLNGKTICLQPGAWLASTDGVKLGMRFAGLISFIAREGLFKLELSGSGTVWFGAYGGIIEKEVDGEYIVDSSHLVAYEPQMKLKMQLAGGLFSSLFSGEGLVTRIEGKGKIWIQTRSMDGLAAWTNRFI